MADNSTAITFFDYGENQDGCILIRKFGDRIVVGLSLLSNGDIEALVDKEVVEKLIVALQEAIA